MRNLDNCFLYLDPNIGSKEHVPYFPSPRSSSSSQWLSLLNSSACTGYDPLKTTGKEKPQCATENSCIRGICKSILKLQLIRAVELHHDDGYRKLIITLSDFDIWIEGLELCIKLDLSLDADLCRCYSWYVLVNYRIP